MKKQKEYLINDLFKVYLSKTENNKRRNPDGTILSSGTKRNVKTVYDLLQDFEAETHYGFTIRVFTGKNQRIFNQLKRKYANFYKKFTDYLFDSRNHTDNTAGSHIKILKSFFNWINKELGITTGPFYKSFYVWQEEIPIIVLNEDQLKFLIFDKHFDQSLSPKLRRAKNIFVFGCTVGLRVGDLLSLTKSSLEKTSSGIYLNNISKKTGVRTKIKLPLYAINIVATLKHRKSVLFLPIGAGNLNKYIKEICEAAGFTHYVPKIRRKRGKPVLLKNSNGSKTRFCDLVTTHTMRRTAITTLLNLGVQEEYVRGISGHAPGSKEFYRYVKYNQQTIDDAVDSAFSKLAEND